MKQLQRFPILRRSAKWGPRQNGFVLILVITAIAAIGAEMFVLTGGANTMLFQSDTAFLRAVERNLAASGLAWAKRNIRNESREIFNRTIELDVSNMDIRNSTLTVTTGIPAAKKVEVQINTSCSRGRQTIRHNGKYRVELCPAPRKLIQL